MSQTCPTSDKPPSEKTEPEQPDSAITSPEGITKTSILVEPPSTPTSQDDLFLDCEAISFFPLMIEHGIHRPFSSEFPLSSGDSFLLPHEVEVEDPKEDETPKSEIRYTLLDTGRPKCSVRIHDATVHSGREIDSVIITHSDEDHIGGLWSLLTKSNALKSVKSFSTVANKEKSQNKLETGEKEHIELIGNERLKTIVPLEPGGLDFVSLNSDEMKQFLKKVGKTREVEPNKSYQAFIQTTLRESIVRKNDWIPKHKIHKVVFNDFDKSEKDPNQENRASLVSSFNFGPNHEFPYLFTADSSLDLIHSSTSFSGERYSMVQLPHHGAIKNNRHPGTKWRDVVKEKKLHEFGTGFFCTGGGTSYHCDRALIEYLLHFDRPLQLAYAPTIIPPDQFELSSYHLVDVAFPRLFKKGSKTELVTFICPTPILPPSLGGSDQPQVQVLKAKFLMNELSRDERIKRLIIRYQPQNIDGNVTICNDSPVLITILCSDKVDDTNETSVIYPVKQFIMKHEAGWRGLFRINGQVNKKKVEIWNKKMNKQLYSTPPLSFRFTTPIVGTIQETNEATVPLGRLFQTKPDQMSTFEAFMICATAQDKKVLAVIYPIKTQNDDLLRKELFYLCAFTCDEHEINKESPVTTPAHVFILAGLSQEEVAKRLDSFQELLMRISTPPPQPEKGKVFILQRPTDRYTSHMGRIRFKDETSIDENFYRFANRETDFVMRTSTGGVLSGKVDRTSGKIERNQHQEHSFYTISSFILQLHAYTSYEVKSATYTASENGYQKVELKNNQGKVIFTFESVCIDTNDLDQFLFNKLKTSLNSEINEIQTPFHTLHPEME